MKQLNLFLALFFVFYIHIAGAQDKKFENNIYASAGICFDVDSDYMKSRKGLTMKLGYGLNYFFTEKISTMVGVALHHHSEAILNQNMDGGDFDDFDFLDFPVIFQGHYETLGKGKVILGVGPVFSFCVGNDDYYIDSDPNDPLNGMEKIKTFNWSIMPCIAYEINRFRIGMDVNIGLRNIKNTHNGLSDGNMRIHDVCATVGVKF